MSHFSVLVVGDVDYNMAPFQESGAYGFDEQYFQDKDITEDVLKDWEEYKKREDGKEEYKNDLEAFIKYWQGIEEILDHESQVNTNLDSQKYGYAIRLGDGKYKVITRGNPNSFYDYYGDGYKAFLLKNPGENGEQVWTNNACKGDIDFKKMFDTTVEKCKATYRKALALLNIPEGEFPTLEHTWSSLVDKFAPTDGSEPTLTRDEAINIYKSQPIVKAWEALDQRTRMDYFGFFSKVDDFCKSEADYIEAQSPHALSFGFVMNRKYTSNGDMGWWAIVSNEKEPKSWDKEYEEFLNSLPDEAELTMLDCHV